MIVLDLMIKSIIRRELFLFFSLVEPFACVIFLGENGPYFHPQTCK